MSTATPGLGQTQEGMVTSAQSTVASSLGLTFSGVNTGNHSMLSMDQQDNAAVSKRDGIAGSNKFHFLRLISLGQAIISLYRRKALWYGMVWTATTQNSRSHKSNIVPERLAEKVWWTKSQSSLVNIYFRLSGYQSSFLLTIDSR